MECEMDRRSLGAHAETIAAQYLQSQGLTILLRNFRRRLGELDIIARQGDVLIVAEVRTRSGRLFGGAAASVTYAKRRRIVRATCQLLQQHRDLSALRVRFDVIVVHQPGAARPRIDWIQHAFAATSRP